MTATATTATTVLFVPGAWHTSNCFDPVIQNLPPTHYKTLKVHLPTNTINANQHRSFAPDIAAIRSQLEQAIASGDHVMIVAHSYGSVPANEAIKGLDSQTRRAKGLKGGVSHLFFCTAFILAEGQSLMSALGGTDLPWFRVSEDRLEVVPLEPERVFYNDCDERVTRKAVAQLVPHSYLSYYSCCTYAAWRRVPSTFLYCLKDAALPMAVQRMMVEQIAKGYEIRTETVDASHSPFLSRPVEMALAIRRAAGENI